MTEQQVVQGTEHPLSTNDHDLLMHEFDYIASTAAQANEDRVNVLAQYLTFGGALVASVFALAEKVPLNGAGGSGPVSGLAWMLLPLALVFLLVGLIGYNSVKQLARLRMAWMRSAAAMNHIKEFYIQHNPALAEVIVWRAQKLPPPQSESIALILSWNVTWLSALSFSAAFYLAWVFEQEVHLLNLTWLSDGLALAFVALIFVVSLLIIRYRCWRRIVRQGMEGMQ